MRLLLPARVLPATALLLALVAALLVPSTPVRAAGGVTWPNPYGLDGAMHTDAVGPAADVEVAWHNNPALEGEETTIEPAPPLVVGDAVVLVISERHGDSYRTVPVAVDRRNGRELWRFSEPVWRLAAESMVITAAGRVLALMFEDGSNKPHGLRLSLVELDAATGAILRTVPSTEQLQLGVPLGDPLLVLDDGDVLVRAAFESGEGVARLDGDTYDVQWRAETGGSFRSNSSRMVAGAGHVHFVQGDDDVSQLHTIDLGTGAHASAAITPRLQKGYLGSADVVALPAGGVAFDASTRVEAWDATASGATRRWSWPVENEWNVTTRIALADDVLVLAELYEGRLSGVDPATGATNWTWGVDVDDPYRGLVGDWLFPSDGAGVVYTLGFHSGSGTSALRAHRAATGEHLGQTTLSFPVDALGPVDEQGRMVVNYRNARSLHLAALAPAGSPATETPGGTVADDVPEGPDCDGADGAFDRVGADDAIGAAVSISQCRYDAGAVAEHAVLARHDVFADALAGTALLGDGPLLFTPTDRLDERTRAELERVLPEGRRIHVLGGPGAVSESVAQALADGGWEVVRLAGKDRVATSIAIAEEVNSRVDGAPRRAALARSYGVAGNPSSAWADSVSFGASAAHQGHPVLLNPTHELDERVEQWLHFNSPRQIVLLGGPGALSDTVHQQLRDRVGASGGIYRAAGPNRSATAVAIADLLWDRGDSGHRLLLNGFADDAWAPGLAAAGLGHDFEMPIVLTASEALPAATAEHLRCVEVHGIAVVGGAGLVPDARGHDAVDAAATAC